MSSLNEGLKKITILEVLIIILALIGIFIIFQFAGYSINYDWIGVFVILYFIYRLRIFGDGFRHDLNNIFFENYSKISFVNCFG